MKFPDLNRSLVLFLSLGCLTLSAATLAAPGKSAPKRPALHRAAAESGDKGGNAGDPVVGREQRIIKLIQDDPATGKSELRERALRLIETNPAWSGVSDADVRGTLVDMSMRGLRSDAMQSHYELKERCNDQDGNSVPATAMPNDRNGPICFNARMLASEVASDDEILGLVFHEHAHHFGYVDPKMAISTAVLDILSSPSKTGPVTGGPVSSPQVPTLPPVPASGEKVCKTFSVGISNSDNSKIEIDMEIRRVFYDDEWTHGVVTDVPNSGRNLRLFAPGRAGGGNHPKVTVCGMAGDAVVGAFSIGGSGNANFELEALDLDGKTISFERFDTRLSFGRRFKIDLF